MAYAWTETSVFEIVQCRMYQDWSAIPCNNL